MHTYLNLSKFAFLLGSVMGLFALGDTHYAAVGNTNATAPFLEWATAATNIQDAVDVASPGDTVLLGNGFFATGGRIAGDGLFNRVAITNVITLRSLNGAAQTIITAYKLYNDGRLISQSEGRVIWLSGGGRVEGVTIMGGVVHFGGGCGGGVFGGGQSNVVDNCIIKGNRAKAQGAGIYGCTVQNSIISGNWTSFMDVIVRPTYGGGASSCMLRNCAIYSNIATGDEAFTRPSSCGGGGAYNSVLDNCTVYDNIADHSSGGGVHSCSLTNCIVTDNRRRVEGYWIIENYAASTLRFSCASPVAPGEGNIDVNPMFLSETNFHLKTASPCINIGTNQDWMIGALDIDGHPRIFNGQVDMGAYEYHATQSTYNPVPYYWLDMFYPDLTTSNMYEIAASSMGANNLAVWESYAAGLTPTNPLSQFIADISVSNDLNMVTWSPDLRPDRVYTVLGKTNLTDATWGPTNAASRFFKVSVELP
jgi:hypothetical protein